jgi:ADP-ribose pyrophosphatase YjhB (NUDIX family)
MARRQPCLARHSEWNKAGHPLPCDGSPAALRRGACGLGLRRSHPRWYGEEVEGHNTPLSEQEFKDIYSKVPRLSVEIIVRDESGAIYLTQRAIEPCINQWHLPGGTVRFGEALFDAVHRIAMRELSIDVQKADNRGYIEYPSHYSKGLDSPVGLVFEVTDYKGNLAANDEASDSGWFTRLPHKMHADQDKFLTEKGYLVA